MTLPKLWLAPSPRTVPQGLLRNRRQRPVFTGQVRAVPGRCLVLPAKTGAQSACGVAVVHVFLWILWMQEHTVAYCSGIIAAKQYSSAFFAAACGVHVMLLCTAIALCGMWVHEQQSIDLFTSIYNVEHATNQICLSRQVDQSNLFSWLRNGRFDFMLLGVGGRS